MNIAAGVLILVAAVLNIMGGCTYAFAGAVTTGAAEMGTEFAEAAGAEGLSASEVAEITEGAAEVSATGAGLGLWGFALFAIAGIMIAGAVFLFKKTKPGFVLLTGALALGAEVGGYLLVPLWAFGWMNIIGVVAGIFAIIASRSFTATAST